MYDSELAESGQCCVWLCEGETSAVRELTRLLRYDGPGGRKEWRDGWMDKRSKGERWRGGKPFGQGAHGGGMAVKGGMAGGGVCPLTVHTFTCEQTTYLWHFCFHTFLPFCLPPFPPTGPLWLPLSRFALSPLTLSLSGPVLLPTPLPVLPRFLSLAATWLV